MRALKIFRILSYIMLPIGGLFGLIALLTLIPALMNPSMWLMLFLFASVVIYTFTSFRFLNKGIERNARCKPSLKDWIKVNAYVTLGMGGMFFINAIGILSLGPVALSDFVTQMMEAQPNLPKGMKPDLLISLLKTVAACMLVISVIVIAHVILALGMVKKFGHLFTSPTNQS